MLKRGVNARDRLKRTGPMADAIFSAIEGYFIYVIEVPVVLGIVLICVYIMYSLNLFRKD